MNRIRSAVYFAGLVPLVLGFWACLCVLGFWEWLHPEQEDGRP